MGLLDGGLAAVRRALTEKQFYRQYMQHIDLRNRANAEQARQAAAQIAEQGFQPGVGANVVRPHPPGLSHTAVSARFEPRPGDTVYLVPKGGWKDAPNGPRVVEGWRPQAHEVLTIDDTPGGLSLYDRYLQAWNAAYGAKK